MDIAKRTNEYHNNSISTSSKGRLVVMMYEGAIRFVTKAMTCMDQKDVAGQGNYIQKTYDIVNELSLALNMDEGGEVSRKLDNLYQFILKQLTLANVKSDKKILESVLKILSTLKEGWDQVFDSQSSVETSALNAMPPKKFAVEG